MGGDAQRFHPAHVIHVLRAGRRLRNKGDIVGRLQDSLPLLDVAGDAGAEEALDLPAPCQQRRHVVVMDMAAMFAHRQLFHGSGPVFRHVSFDASAIKGVTGLA